MNREELRQEAERQARAIWDTAKLPGIADAIVRVAEKYAKSTGDSAENARLAAERDAYKRDLEAHMEGNANLRKKYGARDNETMWDVHERLHQERDQLRAQLADKDRTLEREAKGWSEQVAALRAQLAEARKEGVDSDARAQAACQTIIETIGSCGAENVEEAALRIAPKLAERDAEIERLRKAIVREHDGQEALAQSASKMMTVMHEVAAELRDAYGRDDWHDIEAIAQKLDSAANGETKIDLANESETACEVGYWSSIQETSKRVAERPKSMRGTIDRPANTGEHYCYLKAIQERDAALTIIAKIREALK